MQRGLRTNLVLLAVVVALAGAVYWQVAQEQARLEPPLSAIDTAAVQRIEVDCVACTSRRFERVEGHWRMLAPYALDADDPIVERLLSIAVSPVRVRRAPEELDVAKIGLAPALMTLRIDASKFEFGTSDALRGDRYVRVDALIAMVPDRFSPFLMATAESELDRHLVPREPALRAVRIADVDAAARVPAWRAAVSRAISPRAAAAAPGAGSMRVELTLADTTAITYDVERVTGGGIAHRLAPPLDYALDAPTVDALLGPAGTR